MTRSKITMLIISILAVGLLTTGVMALAGNGNGPGDGLGCYQNQPQDGNGYSTGNKGDDYGGSRRALVHKESGNSYGPGDGTGYGAINSPGTGNCKNGANDPRMNGNMVNQPYGRR